MTLGHEQVLSVPPFRDNEINSVVEILNSRALAEQVVNALGSDAVVNDRQSGSKVQANSQPAAPNSTATEDDSRQKAIRRLMSNLTVAHVRGPT